MFSVVKLMITTNKSSLNGLVLNSPYSLLDFEFIEQSIPLIFLLTFLQVVHKVVHYYFIFWNEAIKSKW